MTTELISLWLGSDVFVGVITAVVTWALSKRKYDREVEGLDVGNMKEALAFYQDLSSDTNQRLEKVLDLNKALDEKVDVLTSENNQLRAAIEDLKRQVEALTAHTQQGFQLIEKNAPKVKKAAAKKETKKDC